MFFFCKTKMSFRLECLENILANVLAGVRMVSTTITVGWHAIPLV
jgi:hypothetical protein